MNLSVGVGVDAEIKGRARRQNESTLTFRTTDETPVTLVEAQPRPDFASIQSVHR